MGAIAPTALILTRTLILAPYENAQKLEQGHPSAENLITLGYEHHDGTTCHMNLWQKVSVSGKTDPT